MAGAAPSAGNTHEAHTPLMGEGEGLIPHEASRVPVPLGHSLACGATAAVWLCEPVSPLLMTHQPCWLVLRIAGEDAFPRAR